MREMCHGCAFREGTEANRHEATPLIAELCVMARETFYCHVDGKVCRGWAAKVAENVSAGEYRDALAWRQTVAQAALQMAEDVNDGADADVAMVQLIERLGAL